MEEGIKGCRFLGKKLYYYPQIDSTNEEARRLAIKGEEEGALVWAAEQTAGRGRRGRSWEAAKEESLLMSALLRPLVPVASASMLTLVQALAVRSAIEKVCGLKTMIKWPNDLVSNGKKLCGILTELQLQGSEIDFVILGTGINVNQESFPKDLEKTATSLKKELKGEKVEIRLLLEEISREFEAFYERFLERKDLSLLKEEYEKYLINKNRQVKVLEPTGEFTGKALGISPKGELLVERADGQVVSVYAGEVSVRGVYGYS